MNTKSPAGAVRPIVVTSTKSVGIQILLVVFLGPLGLFYSTVKGALIMLLGVPCAFAVLIAVTGARASTANGAGMLIALGSELLLLFATVWIGSFIWGIAAVNAFNKQLVGAP